MENLGMVLLFSVCCGHRNEGFCNVPNACPAPACHGGSIQPNKSSGGSAEGRLNKAHPICPEAIVIFRPDWTNIGSCTQCSGARRTPKAGEAVPWDDNSTRRLPRWLRNTIHPRTVIGIPPGRRVRRQGRPPASREPTGEARKGRMVWSKR